MVNGSPLKVRGIIPNKVTLRKLKLVQYSVQIDKLNSETQHHASAGTWAASNQSDLFDSVVVFSGSNTSS